MNKHKMNFFKYILVIDILSFWTVVNSQVSEDCKILNSFLKRTLNSVCCNGEMAKCDGNGNFSALSLGNSDLSEINNFDSFPIFENLKELTIGKDNLNVLPKRFFDNPLLEKLVVYESNISVIPSNYNVLNSLKEVNLEWNSLPEFPYELNKLPNLEHLYLYHNNIYGNIDLSDFKSLTQVDVAYSRVTGIYNIPKTLEVLYLDSNSGIKEIPPEVMGLSRLQEFGVSNTSVTEIPSNFFKLTNLNILKLSDNPQLKGRIINFKNSQISTCKLENTGIECYQEGTCVSNYNSYRYCTSKEVNEILDSQTDDNPPIDKPEEPVYPKEPKFSIAKIIIIIISSLFALLIFGLLIYYRRKNNNNEKGSKVITNSSSNDDVIVERNYNNNNNNNNINLSENEIDITNLNSNSIATNNNTNNGIENLNLNRSNDELNNITNNTVAPTIIHTKINIFF
ncbi:hypothetical protein U3516DRAFT_845302 [Neocallimastix sp. 'constans']